jgi:hypothetical protein
MSMAVTLKDLQRCFGDFIAVNRISLDVAKGCWSPPPAAALWLGLISAPSVSRSSNPSAI